MSQTGYVNHCARFIALILTGLFMFLGPIHAGEEPITQVVRVIGTAGVQGDNVARARKQAISKGLAAAVNSVVLNMMPLEKMVENFQTINEIITGNTDAFVEHYRVQAETRFGTKYQVMVQATVSIENLRKRFSDTGIELIKESLPGVLILISELNLDDPFPRYWWGEDSPYFKAAVETAIAEMLESNGFAVIDPGVMEQTSEIEPDNNQPDISDQGAMALGKQFGADVVVVGQSKVERTENVMGANTRSFSASITARVIRTESGEEITSTDQSATTVSTNEYEGAQEALIEAGSLAGEDLFTKITEIWKKGPEKPAMVSIEVAGTSNLGNFVLFRNILNGIASVKRIQIKELQADTSTIMVDYSGSTKTLADSLMVKTYDTFSINISEVSEDHLRIELVSK